MNKHKILHIEDETMFSETLAARLSDQFEVTLARTGAEIASCLAQTQFDLILLDVILDDTLNALSFIELLRAHGAPIAVLSHRASAADKRAMALLGVAGFIPKNASTALLRKAILAMLDGNHYFPPDFMSTIVANQARAMPDLTPRRREVLAKIIVAMGKTNREMAKELNVSPSWFEHMASDLYYAFNVRNRTGLVVEAQWRGFIPQRTAFAG
jgi:DNA-binding NarL/FixJ family response regulator